MALRDALEDYKRHHADEAAFPGERRTTAGRFSGLDGRLVHVAPDGSWRDFGYPLTGQNGIERSRLGVRADGDTHWFDAADATQTYHGHTALVVTEHDGPVPATQYDLTLGDAHLTHVRAPDADELVVYAGFGPDRQESQLGQLRYEDAVEVYHDREHDFLASAAAFASLGGEPRRSLASLLDDDPVEEPRATPGERYEEDRLSGDVIATLPVADGVTVASLTTDRTETDRVSARDRVRALAADHDSPDALRVAAERQRARLPATGDPGLDADLRVLALLSAPDGLRVAGPDFDPYYAHSGGYGYTWFRDDGEIAQFLLTAADVHDLDLGDWHDRSARAYGDTQCADGTWPHRVWPRNGALAPGWANGRLEAGDGTDYQADQTASVVTFLARYAARAEDGVVDGVLDTALGGLDDTLADDGRPVACQNAWEDAHGRFTHTAATFLDAYATLAASDHDRAAHAAVQAERVYDAVDDLWSPEREAYVIRERDGDLDERLDSASLAIVAAHRAYDRASDRGVDDDRIERLVTHVESVLDGLYRDPDASDVEGLVRYEGDGWRRGAQAEEKIWTVSTAWGANAAAELAALLAARDDPRAAAFAERARDLLALVAPGGPLRSDAGYLAEQYFDDGTPDSATPLGWPHAIRLATSATLAEYDDAARAPADE